MVIRPTSRWVFADLGAGRSDSATDGGQDAAQDVQDQPDVSEPDDAAASTAGAPREPASDEADLGEPDPGASASVVTVQGDDEDDAVDGLDSAEGAGAGGTRSDRDGSDPSARGFSVDDLPAPRPASSVRARYADDAVSGSAGYAPLADDRPGVPSAADVPTAESPVVSTSESVPASQQRGAPVPYVLSFSTGERVVVVGAGLLGRRPYPQQTERFDQLVSIADNERSVSKTHLEFGLETGELWVCDRYSANGTVIIPPAGAPHRCEPGRRYRVPRGGRVEIGDHWFDVR
ncbi:FHA domain-containing protein [Rathayibacter sp. CAU 1779]